MTAGTPDRTFGESQGTPDLHGDDAEILTEAEHTTIHAGGQVGVACRTTRPCSVWWL